MDNSLIVETSFLIDLEREAARNDTPSPEGGSGPAHAFLERHRSLRLFITPAIVGEVAAGIPDHERFRWEAFLAPFRILGHGRDVAWHYGRIERYLRAQGLLIGTNDLWIAAAALAHEVPVVSRNEAHFARVPGLHVMAYED